MKTKNLLSIMLVLSIVFLNSCSKKDPAADECHECHLAIDMDGIEMMWEITNAAGGEDFCGDELEDAEFDSTFVYTVAPGDSLVCTMGGHVLYEGEYGPGSSDSLGVMYEIHCEDHEGHAGN